MATVQDILAQLTNEKVIIFKDWCQQRVPGRKKKKKKKKKKIKQPTPPIHCRESQCKLQHSQ